MSKIKVDTVTNVAGSGAPNIPDGITIGGVALASVNTQEHYAQSTEPSSPKNGAVWYDTDDDKAYVYINSEFYELTYTDIPAIVNGGGRGVFGAGTLLPSYGSSNIIDYITIQTTGNATDFGDMVANNSAYGACSNGSRGLFGGGYPSGNTNRIDYITIATTGNALDFGDLTVARRNVGALSNGTRGVWHGGFVSGNTNTMDFVTIATTGNAQDFGDLVSFNADAADGCADATRGVMRTNVSSTDAFNYITVGTQGNATVFGDSTSGPKIVGACADNTRGLFGANANVIEYITIQTLGNAIDFGDASVGFANTAATSDASRGVFAGGQSHGNVIEYVTIQTPGNATDFGDLTASRYGLNGCSGD